VLSRKNYIGISKVIHEASKTRKFVVVPKGELPDLRAYDREKTGYWKPVAQFRSRTYVDLDILIDGLVDYFGGDNPNFDEQKFRAVSRSTINTSDIPVYIQREE